MSTLRARFWVPPLLAALLAVGAVSRASATPPTSTTYPLQGSQVLADCDGFQVIDVFDTTIVQTDFYDQDGTVVEIHLSIHGTDTYVNSETGEAITQVTHFMARIDTQALQNASAGVVYKLMIPGLGNVLLEAGRSVFDFATGTFVFLAGPHQVTEGDTADLCLALA